MSTSQNDRPVAEPAAISSIATARLPGVDVARALAVLGMVFVNYKVMMGAAMAGPDWLVWLSALLDGRAATLFVVLAGVGISLRARRVREHPEYLSFERGALLKRAAVLFVAGLLNLHMWDWDILHFYGIYLVFAAFLLNARGGILWLLAFSCVCLTDILQTNYDFSTDASLWSPQGLLLELFFEGLHPVFPWLAFLFVGMWLGRQDLYQQQTRRRFLITSLVVTIGCAILQFFDLDIQELLEFYEFNDMWFVRLLFSPELNAVSSSTATAVVALCLCIAGTQQRAERRWVIALVATGQLAFTHYITHAMAILIPLQHGLLENTSLVLSIGYSLVFYAGAVILSVWWRRRWPYGPLEAIIRQLTGRTTPAPWGGATLP